MPRLLIPLVTLLALTACSDREGDNSSFTVNGTNGSVSVDVPGFKADIKLPGGIMDKSDFDIDGVKLYPGSTIETVNVGVPGKGPAGVNLTFKSPADIATVEKHLIDSFAAKSMKVAVAGHRITGTSKDGDAFAFDLTPGTGAQTSGHVSITDTK